MIRNEVMTTDGTITVAIAHGDPVVGAGLRALLSGHRDIATGSSGTSASSLIVTDYDDALRHLRAAPPGESPVILIVTQRAREFDLRTALAAGVHGYLLQHAPVDQLLLAVRMLACGQRYISTELTCHLADSFGNDSLTGRETDVLQLLARGCCNKTIARELGIGVGTVKSHVKGVFDKLGANARTQAVVLATRRGMLGEL